MTIPQQKAMMHKYFPKFSPTWKKGTIIWYGLIRPTELSDEYKIRIKYRLNFSPNVRVLTPKLQGVRHNEPIPHIYNSGNLCLYLPRTNEWTPSMPIAQTIVPWTYKWLYFYEFWQVTGTWSGGGEHPRYTSELKRARQ